MDTTAKLRCTEETDFVVLNYDQSDIEEIEENEENLSHSEADSTTNNFNQHGDDKTPSSSPQRDNPHDEEEELDENESNQEEVNQRLKRRRIHGSQSEGLSNESDIEPVGTSLEDLDQQTCSKLSKENYGGDEDEAELDDDDQEEINVVYFIEEDENGVELDETIMDLRTIKRPRAYRHTPNSIISSRLNLMVCFAITAGIFLGWGNYLGWSANWTKTKAMMTPNNNQENVYIDIDSLKNQIHDLQKLLSAERDEVSKWKSMYEDIQTKLESYSNAQSPSSSPDIIDTNDYSQEKLSTDEYPDKGADENENNDSNGKFYDWLGDIDLTKLVEDGFSSGTKVVVDAMGLIVEKAVEAQKSIPESMHQKINSTMSTLNNLQEKMWQKWAEVRRIEVLSPDSPPEYQQIMNEMTDLLVTSLRKLQEVGTKFAKNIKPIPQKIDKLTCKMSKILDNLENKWRKNREKLNRIGFDESKLNDRDASLLEEADNWFMQRAEHRRNDDRSYPTKESEKRSWLFKRARDRAALRVKGDNGNRARSL